MRDRLALRSIPLLLALFLSGAAPPTGARAQSPRVAGAAETALALKRLNVTGGALYVGAHPDDENTAMLAYLANERRVRTAYLSITRGDGGQNIIGPEKGAALGLVRTQELLAARRIDGAEQFFTRAVDFGYTKSAEEALRVWGHEEVLADVVWVVRRFRPDVIISRFPTTGEGGHGQHTAAAILAREAFEAAADPARFPEQLKHVAPWRAKRLVWNVFRFRPGDRLPEGGKLVSVDLGAYNPLLGESYTEIAARSRTQHKSQGFGSAERRGAAVNHLAHLAGDEAERDLFDGVDLTWRRFDGGEQVGRLLAEAERAYRPDDPQAILPLLLRAHRAMSGLDASDPVIEARRADLLEAVRSAAGLWVEAIAAGPTVVPGGELKVTGALVNRTGYPLRLTGVSVVGVVPDGSGRGVNGVRGAASSSPGRAGGWELKANQPESVEVQVKVPAAALPSQPYWLEEGAAPGLFRVRDYSLVGLPETHPLRAVFTVAAGAEGDELTFDVPVLYRWVDRVRGELYRPVAVVPAVSVNLSERVLVFPDAGTKQLRVTLRGNAAGGASGVLRPQLPAGWSTTPAAAAFSLGNGVEMRLAFTLKPPTAAASGTIRFAVEMPEGVPAPARGVVEIDYPHVPPQLLFPAAEARLVRTDVRRRGERIGYVTGSGDEVPEALRQVGYEVVMLSDEELEEADLTRFDAVVTGVRAYNTRPRLRAAQLRLLEYVERGGTLVVQYNTDDRSLEGFALGPYPLKLSANRVTLEDAPVRLVAPADPLLVAPNRITAADFHGWVQERGLYFPSEWDARYTPLFAAADPGEKESLGLTLIARHGRGTYVYTPLSWFRQLPAGVPGAFRLFVNLVSAGGDEPRARPAPSKGRRR
ncbi:MAG TPA: PIG-L family deacetylase [Pyrinomonadaceae bacterium]|nr:PIG-L family deacetylase [Pyrinomonadaceae bacterium]